MESLAPHLLDRQIAHLVRGEIRTCVALERRDPGDDDDLRAIDRDAADEVSVAEAKRDAPPSSDRGSAVVLSPHGDVGGCGALEMRNL